MSGLRITQPGVLALVQDKGRFGQHCLGLTTGGPLDEEAFYWANRLCENDPASTAIEISIGGLELVAERHCRIAVTGADMALNINGDAKGGWRSHSLSPGDKLKLGFASAGCRSYLAVSGGFNIAHQFGSAATVMREGVGGIAEAAGKPLSAGTLLPCAETRTTEHWQLPAELQPQYSQQVTLRVILGYQQRHFSAAQQSLFFHNSYTVSQQFDRMGYRLTGAKIHCDLGGIVSEGICLGAIQVPADGQPIVLLHDRQTIGGYPKIGAVFSADLGKLTQLLAGGNVNFTPFDINDAHAELLLIQRRRDATRCQPCEE